jgi:hypothetical protein
VQPAVGVDRGRSGIGPAAVATHELRPADEELALGIGAEVAAALRVDHASLDAREQRADRARLDRVRIVGVEDGDRRCRLAHAVALTEDAAQPLGARPLDRGVERCGARVPGFWEQLAEETAQASRPSESRR